MCPHLRKYLAEKFPPKKAWPTLMLIGRDCTEAQKHIQYMSSEDKHQLAIQTPLGWTIMGKPALATQPLVDMPKSRTCHGTHAMSHL